MIPILSGNVASALGGAYEVANSCRFDGSSAYMTKTPGSAGSQVTQTYSVWVKRSKLGDEEFIMYARKDADDDTRLYFENDTLRFQCTVNNTTHTRLWTNRVFRDPSAWYHIVISYDSSVSTPSTSSIQMFINGVKETSFSATIYPSQNEVSYWCDDSLHTIGRRSDGTSNYYNGYMAEAVLIDGSALTASSFGEFDEDSPTIWKPKDVSGLTFGTNGFYLDFEDSANLGNDANGGTDWTETNLAATDQCTDTPTNNFATLNPLDNYYASHTFSEGNCKIVTHSGNMSFNTATIPVSSGKWYVEAKVIDNADSNYHHVGITETTSSATSNWIGVSATHYGLTGYDGKYWRNNSGTSYGISNTTNDIVGMYIDLDNNKLYFAKNGTVMNSGTGISITAAASTTNGYYLISYGDWENASTATWEVNFGNPTYSVSSSNSDPSGYGSFEYSTTITGDGSSKSFYALCTKNLAEFGG